MIQQQQQILRVSTIFTKSFTLSQVACWYSSDQATESPKKGPPPHVYSAIVFEELTSSTRVYGNLQGRATQGPLT